MSDWKPICRVDDIPRAGRAPRARASRASRWRVFRTADDQVFALLDRCPHKGGPLSQGIVFGDSVACPLHNWTIGLADGHARAPDEGCTPALRLPGARTAQVYLDAAELASKALDAARHRWPAPAPAACA